MRLLFLGVHDRDRSPSQRYRFEAFEPHLRSRGIEVTYAGVLTTDEARDFYGAVSPLRKGRIAARALVRRATSLLRPADVVFVQREAFFLLNHWSEWLAHLRAPVVFDFDDAIWIHAISEANRRFAFLKNVEKIPRVVGLSHTVIAGNEYLATEARKWVEPHRVTIIPTCVDVAKYPTSVPRNATGLQLVWVGSSSTLRGLEQFLPTLSAIGRAVPGMRLKLLCDRFIEIPDLPVDQCLWSEATEPAEIASADVGIGWVPDDPWSRGKCGLKVLQYQAAGLPVVANPVGVQADFVHNGVTGFQATTTEEWVNAIRHLASNESARRHMGEECRRQVEAGFSVEAGAAMWMDVLQPLAV